MLSIILKVATTWGAIKMEREPVNNAKILDRAGAPPVSARLRPFASRFRAMCYGGSRTRR
eukprot:10493063-Alexandrium_andersonii.AAC.1